MISLQGIVAAQPYREWRPRFAEAIDGDLFGPEYLDHLLLGIGLATLHVGENAAMVTEFRYYPGPKGHGETVRVIHGLVAAGDLEEIAHTLIPAAEAWGRRRGCRFAMIESREGWQRVLKDSGYSPHQITLVKPLN